ARCGCGLCGGLGFFAVWVVGGCGFVVAPVVVWGFVRGGAGFGVGVGWVALAVGAGLVSGLGFDVGVGCRCFV
ncbi:hypothetical protein KI387_015332, partial [Taxus chinensis]